MFLINYISPRDQTRYRVRAYDLRSRRLRARRPIVRSAQSLPTR